MLMANSEQFTDLLKSECISNENYRSVLCCPWKTDAAREHMPKAPIMFLNIVRDARHFIDEGFVPSQTRGNLCDQRGVCSNNNVAAICSHSTSFSK